MGTHITAERSGAVAARTFRPTVCRRRDLRTRPVHEAPPSLLRREEGREKGRNQVYFCGKQLWEGEKKCYFPQTLERPIRKDGLRV